MRAINAKWLEMSADNRRAVREDAKEEIQRLGWTKRDSFDKLRDAAQESVDAEVRQRAEEREAGRQEGVRPGQLADAVAAPVEAGTSKKRGRSKKHNAVEERTAARRNQNADYRSRKRLRAAPQRALFAVGEHLPADEERSKELNSGVGASTDKDGPIPFQRN